MRKKIDIILPVHNEEENIPLIYKEILDQVKFVNKKYDFEIIFVNDGSTDKSTEEIKKLVKKNSKIKYLVFSRNFGHHAALEAGMKYAKGNAVIMMDADLQHPPSKILEMIKKWEEGFQIVNTKRENTEKIGFLKKIMSDGFYWVINRISDIKIENGSADFRLIDRKVVEVLNKLPEKEKFYRGLINWVGFNTVVINYKVRARIHGKPSYSMKKMINLARIGITSFSMLPMKIILSFGILLSLFGGIFFVVTLIGYFFWENFFSGSTILGSFILMNTGFIVIMLGINSTYLLKALKQVENRPSYIIMESNINE